MINAKIMLMACGFFLLSSECQGAELWSVGKQNQSAAELALGPNQYKDFLKYDFGFEDRYFLIGWSQPKRDFAYVLPGPRDTWGGTWDTAGWRTHEDNILFQVNGQPARGRYLLALNLVDSDPEGSLVKLTVNGHEKKFRIKGSSKNALEGNTSAAKPQSLQYELSADELLPGGNRVTISVLEGGWICVDNVSLDGPAATVISKTFNGVFLRGVSAAGYELENEGKRCQPLLVDVERLEGNPLLTVELEGKEIFRSVVDTSRYVFEAPMPVVNKSKKSAWRVLADGKVIEQGSVWRRAQHVATLAEYVDTRMGTAHSRWMIAPGPWMPMSMVKLSPDNQNAGWQAGYQPTFETLGCFSHIHEWTMAGLGIMPTNGKLYTEVGDEQKPDEGYRSRIDKSSEQAPLGYYKVFLTDTKITAEATATERASMLRFTFPKDQDGRVMIDLHIPAEYDYQLRDIHLTKVSDYRIEGVSHQLTPQVWSNDADQEYTVNFVMEFDQPIKHIGGWKNKEVYNDVQVLDGHELKDAGMFVEFDTQKSPVVQVRTGISLVSVKNADENLKAEISNPFGWSFAAVVDHQHKVWNDVFDRVRVTSNDRREKVRFYTNVYRALCRNRWSDVNGDWMTPDETVKRFENTDNMALGCDAFWNTFWNLNQFWNLITPEWSNRWVNSQLAMYKNNGWLAKGPAGMEYIPVMVAEHEIPLLVSAYQMGIRNYDAHLLLEATKKMQTTPATHVAGGYAGNRDLAAYMKYHYVPYEKGRYSNTMEYSFDDWTVGQLAKALGDEAGYQTFNDRGYWWRNAINPENGYCQLKDTLGHFMKDFNPFRSGANQQYVEGNAWQLSYFVPQDVPALVRLMGPKTFVDRLEWGFEASEPWRYNAPNDQYWDFPVVQGNQQSMQFAFLFNWAGKPWLTQRWSRSIIDRYYGFDIANAYLGDEDQGQMSAWFVMAALGLFQTDGGARVNPIYEIASPIFEKTVIDLGRRFGRGDKFTIEARNVSRKNKYVQKATLNGQPLNSFQFAASELLKGGSLILEMGSTPNMSWGIQ
jgi:predicted alpha-1,2-mannosidase